MERAERIASQYLRFAEEECQGYSPLYFELSKAVAADPALIEFIAGQPEPQPNLFFASIQFLLGLENLPGSATELKRVVTKYGTEITSLMRTRRTQTSEVGRCASILPALPQEPLALLEVGASGGLCLNLDRYAYDYGEHQIGAASPVTIRCHASGAFPPPATVPEIAWRGGIDLAPIDLTDPDSERWLLACIWPGQQERRTRAQAAIRVAKANPIPLHKGDLLSDLPPMIASVPEGIPLVIFHSAVLAYVARDDRRRFAGSLAEASHLRDIVWISNESPGLVLDTELPAPVAKPSRFLLSRARFRRGSREDQALAFVHPHGATLDWIA